MQCDALIATLGEESKAAPTPQDQGVPMIQTMGQDEGPEYTEGFDVGYTNGFTGRAMPASIVGESEDYVLGYQNGWRAGHDKWLENMA